MGNKPIYKLSEYVPTRDEQTPMPYTAKRYSEIAPLLNIFPTQDERYYGRYYPGEYKAAVRSMPDTTAMNTTAAHEITHYLHDMYPMYGTVEKSRDMDTLKTIMGYLSGRVPGGGNSYWDDPTERLARAGETALPKFRKAVDILGEIDQRKIDSLAAGKQLVGESIINEPPFIKAMMTDHQYNEYPLEGNNNIDMYGNEELRERAKDELYRRMEKFYAETYKHLKEKEKNNDTTYVVPPLEELLKGGTALNDMHYRNKGEMGFTPGYDYSLQSYYEIPYSGIDDELIDWERISRKRRISSSADYDEMLKNVAAQQKNLLEKAKKKDKKR